MKSIITEAGDFPVKQEPAHHFSDHVLMMAPRCGVLHTTEGSFQAGREELLRRYAPHFMLGFNEKSGKAEIIQFVPIGYIGAALMKHNNQAIVQIEMVGFAEEGPWLPGATVRNPHAETLDALCSLMVVCEEEWGIPFAHPWHDGDYGRYGFHTPHRIAKKFGKTAGWYGHADVPDNAHWDPGNLQWSKVFEKCKTMMPATPVAKPPLATPVA